MRSMILNNVDENYHSCQGDQGSQDTVHDQCAGQGQGEDQQRGQNKHNSQIHARKPSVVCRDVSQNFGQTDRPSHKWNGVENQNSSNVKK